LIEWDVSKEGLAQLLSLFGLESGYFPYIVPQLFAGELGSFLGSGANTSPSVSSDAFFEKIVNHSLPLNGIIVETANDRHFEYLMLPSPPEYRSRRDIFEVFDAALATEQRSPHTLDIVVRTVLNRPHLLNRVLESLAVLVAHCPSYLNITIRIVCDREEELLKTTIVEAKMRWPHLVLSGTCCLIRKGRHSRMDLLLQGIELSEGDHIWFVDDDDFVMPGVIDALARVLCAYPRSAIITEASYYEEEWVDCRLESFIRKNRTNAANVRQSSSGENHVPVCCMILPVEKLKGILANVQARGDYLEDYFILLHYLSTPPANVQVIPLEVAGISIRGKENTVSKLDLRKWELSYVEVMQEVFGLGRGNVPLH
jgi:hypothetical protein